MPAIGARCHCARGCGEGRWINASNERERSRKIEKDRERSRKIEKDRERSSQIEPHNRISLVVLNKGSEIATPCAYKSINFVNVIISNNEYL